MSSSHPMQVKLLMQLADLLGQRPNLDLKGSGIIIGGYVKVWLALLALRLPGASPHPHSVTCHLSPVPNCTAFCTAFCTAGPTLGIDKLGNLCLDCGPGSEGPSAWAAFLEVHASHSMRCAGRTVLPMNHALYCLLCPHSS